jgi:hypothetical protein
MHGRWSIGLLREIAGVKEVKFRTAKDPKYHSKINAAFLHVDEGVLFYREHSRTLERCHS